MMLRQIASAVGLLLVAAGIVLLVAATPLIRLMPIGAGYSAKALCSGVFLSDREASDIIDHDLTSIPFFGDWAVTLDRHAGTLDARVGLANVRAVYRENTGCTLVAGGVTEEHVRAQDSGPGISRPTLDADAIWPEGRRVDTSGANPDIDSKLMAAAFEYAFDEPRPDRVRGTRALVVVHKGRIVAEQYAPGYHKDMPLASWSMTKTVSAALTGVLVGDGKLDIHAPAPVPEWSEPGDPRSAITLDHLLRMSSGLEFEEEYVPDRPTAVSIMLYEQSNAAVYAAGFPLDVPPDTEWYYSSGTTNIISRTLRDAIGGAFSEYIRFPYERVFNRLGMSSAVMEVDASGNFVGSSFMYCTPRDWARFGLFLMQDGVWNGNRILPEGWVDYMRTPTPHAPQGQYGAQTWLNAGDPGNPENRPLPDVPTDTFYLSGYEGQRVFVIPSRDVVIVRMGLTIDAQRRETDDVSIDHRAIDYNELTKRVLAAIVATTPEF